MREPNDSGIVGWAFSICVAALLVLAVWPALANAPVMVKPVAECADRKCVMSESDYLQWVDFNQRVLRANDEIVAAFRGEQELNAALRQQLARVARGCGNERQTRADLR